MSDTAKAILIVGGVGVGAFVLLKLLSPRSGSTGMSSPRPSAPTDYGLVTGLLNFGAAAIGAYGASSSQPVYEIGKGYVSGGANAPIDPTTGGVILPAGEIYGPSPRLPT